MLVLRFVLQLATSEAHSCSRSSRPAIAAVWSIVAIYKDMCSIVAMYKHAMLYGILTLPPLSPVAAATFCV